LIAEIGINHNGDMKLAKQLIDAASDAGFDAVKFQKRTIDVLIRLVDELIYYVVNLLKLP
jgi:sialic acid synthase SpsE